VLAEVLPAGLSPKVLVLDPPRAGAGGKVMRRIARACPERIVYVSCNPTTLARDLVELRPFGYTVTAVQPLDLFPQTYHVETVVALNRDPPRRAQLRTRTPNPFVTRRVKVSCNLDYGAVSMPHDPLAGKPAPAEILVDVDRLVDAYFTKQPDVEDTEQLVSFGTSGHRGSSLLGSFNEAHILAVTQAICEYRRQEGITGPLFLGKDTHALSRPAERTALEVLAANSVLTIMQRGDGYTPTPAISRMILVANRGKRYGLGDGIVVTPSHNPPADGGFKYNPPNGGPADTNVTAWIQDRANELLRKGNRGVRRVPIETALKASTTRPDDFVAPYVEDLAHVVDMEAIRTANIKCGAIPWAAHRSPTGRPSPIAGS
jgi:hypothetical protein